MHLVLVMNADLKSVLQNHINFRAHTALADSLVLYLRKQLCEVRRRDARPDVWEQAYPPIWPHALGNVPRVRCIADLGCHGE